MCGSIWGSPFLWKVHVTYTIFLIEIMVTVFGLPSRMWFQGTKKRKGHNFTAPLYNPKGPRTQIIGF